jgi:hypothetical protein
LLGHDINGCANLIHDEKKLKFENLIYATRLGRGRGINQPCGGMSCCFNAAVELLWMLQVEGEVVCLIWLDGAEVVLLIGATIQREPLTSRLR